MQPEPACGNGGPGADLRSGNYVAIVGVRLHGQVRVTQFNSGDLELEMGEQVIVEGGRTEVGVVAQPTTHARKSCSIGCMKRVLRIATPQDREEFTRRVQLEADAHSSCQELIRKKRLQMKLVNAQRVEETRKITFTFTAEGRVDFRDLVRDLARRFRSRIEMRQIGVRDEARALGGYGDCGRALCCSSFLKEFSPISIKMAREQNLSLNPSKISGMCGRLKCCLRYEYQAAGDDSGLPPEDEPLPPAPPDVNEASPPA
jgi:cell fate regulator YaaT (PSP1 superfamily)